MLPLVFGIWNCEIRSNSVTDHRCYSMPKHSLISFVLIRFRNPTQQPKNSHRICQRIYNTASAKYTYVFLYCGSNLHIFE